MPRVDAPPGQFLHELGKSEKENEQLRLQLENVSEQLIALQAWANAMPSPNGDKHLEVWAHKAWAWMQKRPYSAVKE